MQDKMVKWISGLEALVDEMRGLFECLSEPLSINESRLVVLTNPAATLTTMASRNENFESMTNKKLKTDNFLVSKLYRARLIYLSAAEPLNSKTRGDDK